MKRLILVLALAVTATASVQQPSDPKSEDNTIVAQRFCPRGQC